MLRVLELEREFTWKHLFSPQLHYNSKTLKTESPSVSRGSSLPFSKEPRPFGVKDVDGLSNAVPSKTNSLTAPPVPSLPSGTAARLFLIYSTTKNYTSMPLLSI